MFLINPEIKKYLFIQALVSFVLILIAFIFGVSTGIIVVLTTFVLNLSFFVYTAIRYQEIHKLSRYLTRISNGEYTLDVRDNIEGELSILKSEIFKVTQKLLEYTETLKKDKINLSNSLADISHQLKTPLTSMSLMCELIKDEDLPVDKRKEFVKCIFIQLERIEWLVLTLLKISRLDAGVVVMKKENISAINLIDKALIAISIDSELKDIDILINIGHEITFNCDIQWTCEAIINLLKNCVEHTPRNGIIRISVQDNPLFYEISIADNGCGIDKEDLPHVFTRFYRGKNASKDSVGIGLAMARSIIRNQQGDITLESVKNKGSRFVVRLYKTIV